MSAAILASLLTVSDALAKAGVPPLSPYWRQEAERFYLHPTARLLVECVGRGGDKSRTSTMMAIAEVLEGEFNIAPGERHFFTHVAENRDEASKTLGVLEQYLRILRVPFARSGDTIDLAEMPRGFRVLACRVGAVSGFRCIGWTADESGKWDSEGSDPAPEVIASIKAMSVTHPNARGRLISSPLATLGYFYETWIGGASAEQVTGHAPSWVANPSITEEQTHKLERDPRKHAREYGAVPTEGSEESFFPAHLVDRARRTLDGDLRPEPGVSYTAAQDPSLGRNSWTLVIVGRRMVEGRPKASVVLAREWRAAYGSHFDMTEQLERVAGVVRPFTTELWTDQFHAESLAAIAQRLELPISISVDKPTGPERLERYESILTRLSDDEIELHRDARLRADLLSVRRRFNTAGGYTVHLPVTGDGRHADFAPSATLALSKVSAEPSWGEAMTQLAAAGGSIFGPQAPRKPKSARVTTHFLGGTRFECTGVGIGALPTDRADVHSCERIDFDPEASPGFVAAIESMARRADFWRDDREYDPDLPENDEQAA